MNGLTRDTEASLPVASAVETLILTWSEPKYVVASATPSRFSPTRHISHPTDMLIGSDVNQDLVTSIDVIDRLVKL